MRCTKEAPARTLPALVDPTDGQDIAWGYLDRVGGGVAVYLLGNGGPGRRAAETHTARGSTRVLPDATVGPPDAVMRQRVQALFGQGMPQDRHARQALPEARASPCHAVRNPGKPDYKQYL